MVRLQAAWGRWIWFGNGDFLVSAPETGRETFREKLEIKIAYVSEG